MCVKKKVIALFLAITMVFSVMPLMAENAYGLIGSTDKSVYAITNYQSGDCILSASVCMLRRAAIISKKSSYWSNITLDTLAPSATNSNRDLLWNYAFTKNGLTYTVRKGNFTIPSTATTNAAKDAAVKSQIDGLLSKHMAGIVVWDPQALASNWPHGILIAYKSSTTGKYKCADSSHNVLAWGQNVGLETYENTTMVSKGRSYRHLTQYWYVDSVTGTPTGSVTPPANDVVTPPSVTVDNPYTVKCMPNYGTGGKTLKLKFEEHSKVSGSWVSRSGYALGGWRLYRVADKKWFTGNTHGWQTSSTISTKGYSREIYDINTPVQVNDSWIAGKRSAKEFEFYPVWLKKPKTPDVYINLKTSTATKSTNYRKAKATWASESGVTYRVRYSINGEAWSSWGKPTTNGSFEKYLNPGNKITIQVRGYKKDTVMGTNKLVYGNIDTSLSLYALKTPILSLYKAPDRGIKVKWTNISGETGYEIYRKVGSSGTWTKVKTIGRAYSSWTNLRKQVGTTYYYKVRAYKKIGTKTVYGPFSTAKYIKR